MATRKIMTLEDQIRSLESSIQDCERKLATTYDKAIHQLRMRLESLNKKIGQARQSAHLAREKYVEFKTKAKLKKTAASEQRLLKLQANWVNKKEKIRELTELQKVVKNELTQVFMAYKKQVQRQKAITQFERMWLKRMSKKKSNRKSARASIKSSVNAMQMAEIHPQNLKMQKMARSKTIKKK